MGVQKIRFSIIGLMVEKLSYCFPSCSYSKRNSAIFRVKNAHAFVPSFTGCMKVTPSKGKISAHYLLYMDFVRILYM